MNNHWRLLRTCVLIQLWNYLQNLTSEEDSKNTFTSMVSSSLNQLRKDWRNWMSSTLATGSKESIRSCQISKITSLLISCNMLEWASSPSKSKLKTIAQMKKLETNTSSICLKNSNLKMIQQSGDSWEERFLRLFAIETLKPKKATHHSLWQSWMK